MHGHKKIVRSKGMDATMCYMYALLFSAGSVLCFILNSSAKQICEFYKYLISFGLFTIISGITIIVYFYELRSISKLRKNENLPI